jgi:N-acetylmuramoyl-L-alanine amidase
MRKITKIIVHCADTPEWRDDKAADIRRWHKARGFNDIGYHYVVDLDGTIEPGRDVTIAGAHTTGHNADSIGVCYIGGADTDMKPKDTRTEAQKTALRLLLKYLVQKYPGAKIYGHRDFAQKACPSFDAKTEYKELCE